MAAPERYPRSPNNASPSNAPFAAKTTALLFLRALTSGLDFRLGAHALGAGALDDVVLRVGRRDGGVVTCFLQLKHTDCHLVYRQMLTGAKATLPVRKYFQSYLEIKDSLRSAQRGILFDARPEDCLFIAYTNARADSDLGDGQPVSPGSPLDLVWSGRGGVHAFDPADDGDVWDCVREGGGDARRFLRQFRVLSGQPGVGELDQLIREELGKVDDERYRGVDVERLCVCFLEQVNAWWERDDVVLDRNSDLLENARMAMMCSKFALK